VRSNIESRIALTGASEIHHALCAPEFEQAGNFEVASRVLPLRHVGGDIVCTIHREHDSFLFLADVMGKGLAAAMWTTHLVDLLHRAAEGSRNTCELMTRLNQEIMRSRVRAPLTSAVAVHIDHHSDATYCSVAGHPAAVVLRNGSAPELVSEGGPILGVVDTRYTCRKLHLAPGESIVAFSDGVLEIHNASQEEFGTERSVAALSLKAAVSAEEKVSSLLAATLAFAEGRQLDDISIMALQRN
jgi:sigma-B regulation protein RsbU (phosphoserine phosphatase)